MAEAEPWGGHTGGTREGTLHLSRESRAGDPQNSCLGWNRGLADSLPPSTGDGP